MDTDLLQIARRLAEGGHLPGVRPQDLDIDRGVVTYFDPIVNDYTLAEPFIHHSVHTAITDPKRGWNYECDEGMTRIWDDDGRLASTPGTTTLSLLTAFAAALEASK